MPAPPLQELMRQLLRARLSSDDFSEAVAYLEKLKTETEDVTRRGLLTAAIAAYCRPFTKNDQGAAQNSTPQLSVKLTKLFTRPEQQLHDLLKSLRNEVVAHTSYDKKPVKRLSGDQRGFSMSGSLFDLLSEKIDFELFTTMCRALGGYCFTKMMNLNTDIVRARMHLTNR